MCGIVGIAGKENVVFSVLEALKRLEYRGYDSAGLAVLCDGGINVCKQEGRIGVLAESVKETALSGSISIGHTRWATHGKPIAKNAHPFLSQNGRFAVVHNGIIENYLEIKEYLLQKGYHCVSDTDSEVVAHLLDCLYRGDIVSTIIKATEMLLGAYALGIITVFDKDAAFAVKKDNPLIVGLGDGSNYFCSDIPTINKLANKVCFLNNGEIVRLTNNEVRVYDSCHKRVKPVFEAVEGSYSATQSESYMYEEMQEVPNALVRAANMYKLPNEELLQGVRRLYFIGCGTSYHAAEIADRLCSRFGLIIPHSAELASEFPYIPPILDENCLVVAITQSGETLDTLTALRYAKKYGSRTLSVCNVRESSIVKASDGVLLIGAGAEIAVASTKAYNASLVTLTRFVVDFAYIKSCISDSERETLKNSISELSSYATVILEDSEHIRMLAVENMYAKSVFYLGRGLDYFTAKEGSLKLKEISYIHSEAYSSGELKHGTLALIEQGVLVVSIVTDEKLLDKAVNAICEVKARGGKTVTITCFDYPPLLENSDSVIHIPIISPLLAPILAVIPCQWFSYYIARAKGCDIDKPRNLAKSVTVT